MSPKRFDRRVPNHQQHFAMGDFMLKKITIAFGVVFVVVGALGFVPAATPNGRLLGVFEVNALHNFIHLATGIVAILVGMANEQAMRNFFRIFGVIYGIVALLGFYYGGEPLLGLVANNLADSGLHVVIAAVALYLGFGFKPTAAATV